uniref:Uncharacterized protein n=1 Tax=Physcomitrium patens TaxID=3218 RepID=A0A2K1JRJ9_PHYPA|nr:hypothetical protein PHYPA_016543 [Physcomitrium patens]
MWKQVRKILVECPSGPQRHANVRTNAALLQNFVFSSDAENIIRAKSFVKLEF